MDRRELLWRQYSLHIDLYKFYMDLVVKFNIFYYAVTGAIASFYFANPSISNLKYSLLLPLVMSITFAGLFGYGAWLMRILRQDVFEIRNELVLQTAPDVRVLSILLYIFAVVFLLVAAGCAYVIWCH